MIERQELAGKSDYFFRPSLIEQNFQDVPLGEFHVWNYLTCWLGEDSFPDVFCPRLACGWRLCTYFQASNHCGWDLQIGAGQLKLRQG